MAHYGRIIAEIRRQSAATEIVVQSIFPVGPAFGSVENKIEQVNGLLREACLKGGIVYLDVFSALYKDGWLNPEFTLDGMHLNGRGYLVWK